MAVDRDGEGLNGSPAERSLRQRAADRLRRLLGLENLAADPGERYEQDGESQRLAGGPATHGVTLGAEAVRSPEPGLAAAISGPTAVPTTEGLPGVAPAPSMAAAAGAVAAPALSEPSAMGEGSGTGVTPSGPEPRGGTGGGGGPNSEPAPPLSASGQSSGVAIEDDQLSATGQLVAAGGIHSHIQAGTYRGVYGVLTVESSGRWSYQLDNADPHVQRLNNGDVAQDHFQCQVVDGRGLQQQVPLFVVVRGTDDAAVISGVRTGAITEDQGAQGVSGQLNASDIDRGDQPSFVAQTLAGSYGTFVLQADGQWQYNADPQKIQGLKEGQQVVETFPLQTTNGQGESVSGSVSVTVTGTDDRSVLPAVSLTATEDGGIVTGRLVATDVDATALHYETVPGSPGVPGVSIAADGSVRVDPSQSQFQSLAAGEHRDLQIPVQVVDERGTAVQSLLSVRIDGSNDAPVVTVRPPLPVDEGSGVHTVQVLASDVDTTDTLTYGTPSGVPLPVGVSLDPATGQVSIDTNYPAYNSLGVGETRTLVLPVVVSDGHGGSTTTQVSLELHGTNDAPTLAAIGQRTATEGDAPFSGQLSAVDPDTNDQLTYGVAAGIQLPAGFAIQSDGHWSFDPQDPAYNALRAGDHQQLLIPLQVSDGHGGVSSQTLAIDLSGSNDRAVISGTSTGSVTEDRTLQAAGVLSIVDPDAGEAQFKPAVLNGLYGQLHLNADGSWAYTLDNTNPKVQALPAGGSLSDQLLVLSADGTAHQVRIQIGGTDDAAQVSGVTSGQVREDVVMTASGQLTVRDIDQGETPQFQSETLQGIYGQLSIDATGQWHYQLDPAASQQLQDGVKARESFTVLASDAKGHQVSQQVLVDITGTNDAARISGTSSGQVTEDTLTHVGGKLDVQDVDRGEAHFQAGDQSGSYGSLHLGADGTWGYTLNNSNPKVQELPAGTSATETFTVRSADGTTHQLTVQIAGTNDAARISGTSSGQVTEDTLTHVGGKLDVQDVDRGEAHFVAGDQSGSYGNLHLGADGTWEYTLNNSSSKVQELPAGASATETFTVRSADGTTHQLTVQIAGTNDAATISGSSSGRVTEDGTLRATGQLQVSDADRQQSAFDPGDVGDKVGTYGTFHLNADGSWSYQLNNSAKAVQDLQAGDTRQDSFTVHSVDGTSHQLQMTVVGASDAPVLTAGQISGGREDTSITISQAQILQALHATDPDGDHLSVASVRYSDGTATLVDNHDGTWTLTPHANWAGDLHLQVGVSDGHDTTTGTLTVPIAAVADKVTMTVAPSLSSSFEDPNLGNRGNQFVDPIQWGWHTDNVSGQVEQGKGETYGDPNHVNTGVIELEGYAGEKDNLYRVLDTQPGAAYHFSLDVSGRVGVTTVDGAAVEVLWEGKVIDTIRPAANVFGFVRYDYDLTAHTDHPRIEFRALTHDGSGPVVDNPNFVFKGFQGTEDTPLPIRLSVETADKDGSETTSTSIKGLPAGFVISDGTTGHQLTSGGPTQLLDMQGWDLQHIVVTPLLNFNGDVNAVLVATSTEASNHDQSSTQIPVTLNFAGVNDNPTVQITSGTALQEGSSATSSEQISGSDIDGDRTSVDSAWLSSHGWSSSDGGVSYSKAGTYGTATVTVASGQVSYQLNNAAGGATDQLSEGQSVSDQFHVQITDGHQGTAGTAVATALFNVQGTNDAPVVTAGTATPLAEGSSGTATSILTMRDPDSNDPSPTIDTTWLVSHGWSTADGGSTYTRAGTYGSATLNVHTSTVSYHLDNTAGGATDHLAEGQSVHDDFGIQVVDSHGASATVTPTFGVTGTNDAPTVTASNPSLGSAVEEKDGAATPVIYTEQQLLTLVGATDRDGGDSLHVTHVTAESGFGSFAKLANGNWQYTPPADAHKANVSVSVTVEDAHKGSSTAQAVLDVRPATDSAKASLDVTTEAQVMHFSAPGQHAFKETGAGPMSAFSLEVMAVGDPANKGSTSGGQGQVLFNLSAPPSDNNILSLWRPAALSIAFKSSDHATNPPLDLTTGQHRLTLTWDSATGVLTLYDNGKEYQHWDNIHKGETIPANTIATVGQKMGSPDSKSGFDNNEQFHGDLFSVTLASQKVGAGDVGVPLATHMPRNQLLMDLREANGQVVDTLAAGSAHPITAPNVGTATQQVSTTASLPPSGARLNLNLAVTPPADPDDHISRELLRGLPPGTVLSDGSGGHSFTVPANGEVSLLTDLNGWQHLNQLSAQLPTGYHQNLPLQLVVETTGPNGAISRVSTDSSVLFDPSAQVPALPPLARPADVDQAPTVTAGSETTNEDTSYAFKAADFGYGDRDGDALHHITVTNLPPASEGQLLLGGVAVHAGQEILAARIGDLSFQPAKDFNGDSHFGFSASDGSKDSAAAQMGVHVSPVADQTTATVTVGQDRIQTTDFDVQAALSQSGRSGLQLHAFGVGTSPIDPVTGNIDPQHLKDTATLQRSASGGTGIPSVLEVFGGKSGTTVKGQPTFVDAGGQDIGKGPTHNDDSQLNQGESILVSLPAQANSAQLTLKSFNNKFVSNDHLVWHAFDANGHEVAHGDLSVAKSLGGPSQDIHNLEIHAPQPFTHLLIAAAAPIAAAGYSSNAQAVDRSAFEVEDVMAQLIVHTTELKLGAQFAGDYHGQGESVSYRISGLSEEARLDHGTRQSDGSWLVTAQEAAQLHLLHTREQHLSVTAITRDGSSERSSLPLALDVAPKGSIYEVISGRHTGEVFEAGDADRLETGGNLQVDSSSGASPHFLPQTITNAYGTFSNDAQGHWHFLVDVHSQATQALGGKEVKEFPFSVSTSDGLQQNVMVRIIGFDTAPVIGGVIKGAVTEDQAGQTDSRGHVDFIDPDSIEHLGGGKFLATGAQQGGAISATGSTTIHGKYGDLVVQANGDWAYHLDPVKADPLRSGQVEKEVFTLLPVEHALVGGVEDTSHSEVILTGRVKIEIAVHGTDDGPAQVGGASAGQPPPPPPTPGSQHSPELQDLLQQLQAAGLALTETQLATSHRHSDPLTGASSDVLELHTDHGTVVQTLTTHADGTSHVALDTTGLDASAQAALPAHAATAGATQLHQADAPQPHDSTPDQIDHGLDPSAFQLDHADPAALQAAVHSLSTAEPADLPSLASPGLSDQTSHEIDTTSTASSAANGNAAIDADQLAHAAQEVAAAPLSTEPGNDGTHAPGAEPIPISAPSDPFTPDGSHLESAPDEASVALPPLPDQNHDQTLDHLSSLS